MRQALDLAEQQRGHSAGAEQDRAQAFSQFANSFEHMVEWQTELGSPAEAFAAIERGHARSLLDEIGIASADLQIGHSLAERDTLARREAELKMRVAALEKQVQTAKDQDKAGQKLADARAALFDFYREAHSSSPVYRNLVSASSGPPRLSQVQRHLPDSSHLLVYFLGEENGYLVSVGPKAARIYRLHIAGSEAKALGIDSGALTARRLRRALLGEPGKGLVPRLAQPAMDATLVAKLAALWRTLVPQAERAGLLDGSVTRLLVVPDGPLALLPLETLVVDENAGGEPKYLLDVGPALAYGPSATVLDRLAGRSPGTADSTREPVLAVGDPSYPNTDSPAAGSLAALSSRSLYRGGGGRLTPLPFTGWEIQWVSDAFTECGVHAAILRGAAAAEASVRATGHRAAACFISPATGWPTRSLAISSGAGLNARTEGRHRAGRRRLPDVGGDLRPALGGDGGDDPVGMSDQFRSATAGRGDVGMLARLPGCRKPARGGQRLAGGRRGGSQPGQPFLRRTGTGGEGRKDCRLRGFAARGKALGSQARQVAVAVLLGLARPGRAAVRW